MWRGKEYSDSGMVFYDRESDCCTARLDMLSNGQCVMAGELVVLT